MISLLLVIAFLFGVLSISEGKHLFKPYVDTIFAENYTPEKFKNIKIGMSTSEVKLIIGKPLYINTFYPDSTKTEYSYTGDGKLYEISRRNKLHQDYYDCAWYRSNIIIYNDTVVDISKGWSYD